MFVAIGMGNPFRPKEDFGFDELWRAAGGKTCRSIPLAEAKQPAPMKIGTGCHIHVTENV